MTRKLDLRTGRPVWLSYRAPKVPVTPLTRDEKADLVIVGMGISGAMIADAASEAGLSVIALDRRGPLLGSTPATTALVQFEIDQPLTKLSKMVGRSKAEQAWRRSRLAVAGLEARIRELDIECHLAPRKTLYLAGDVMDADALQEESAMRRAAGLHSRFIDGKKLKEDYAIARDGAIESHGNLALDPRKLAAGLLLEAAKRGARFHAPVEATGFETSADAVRISTDAGPVITAANVVVATGYELPSLSMPAKHSVISTWAIATKPQKRNLWRDEAFIWEASEPYLYLRATHDGRVICGGEDEEFTDEDRRDALIDEKTATISRKLGRLMPGIDPTPELRWAGSFGTTTTGLPFIGALPRKPRIHAVMGYGGNGITFSRIASEIIVTRLTGRRDADEDLFAFDR